MKVPGNNNSPVLFIDSGIGGIPYCRHFKEKNPSQNIVYLADREHFPYGDRERKELAGIIIELTEEAINKFNPKIIVLACNTASLAALSELREKFPLLPFVGTVPAVKPAVLATKTGKIGVLGTELTINEPYLKELAARYGSCEIIGIAAPELVEFVEKRFFSAPAEEKETTVRSYIDRFISAGADGIVLGCTHFLLLLEEFHKEAAGSIAIFESINGISQRLESLLGDSLPSQRVMHRLVITGEAEPEAMWLNWAECLGFRLSLMDRL